MHRTFNRRNRWSIAPFTLAASGKLGQAPTVFPIDFGPQFLHLTWYERRGCHSGRECGLLPCFRERRFRRDEPDDLGHVRNERVIL